MEVTIYEDEKGEPKVQVKDISVTKPKDVARVYKAIKKELKKEKKEES